MDTITAKAPHAVRLVLGLAFFVFGLNGFLQFLPQPDVTEEGGAFLGALAAAGYMFPLIKGTEVIAGALLLSNRFVPLALTLLAPVLVNIVAFHTWLSPGVGLPLVLTTAALYLAWAYRAAFVPMLRAKVQPVAPDTSAQGRVAPAGT